MRGKAFAPKKTRDMTDSASSSIKVTLRRWG